MRNTSLELTDRLTIINWSDGLIDLEGHDARSPYVERYWLGVLGPTATWILRRIADELEASPSGFVMDVPETAQSLGVGANGPTSPFVRGVGRLIQFEIAQITSSNMLAVRRRLPSLSRRHLLKLPSSVQQRHDFWMKQQAQRAS